MFVNAISQVSQFTRPVKFISRNYKSEAVVPGLATMFFVNDSGCAITCRHVAEQILENDRIQQNYHDFSAQAAQLRSGNPANYKKELRSLEKKYGYQNGVLVNRLAQLVNVPEPLRSFDITTHDTLDLALIRFHGFEHLNYQAEQITLLADDSAIAQGRTLCRLGFPFPEFTDFRYDSAADNIAWVPGPASIPSFPLDGMITRHLQDESGQIYGFELSTPGLRGQSGGPVFDTQGRIYGMQFETKHLHLGFDMENQQILVNGEKKTIHNQPFLHIGQCLHIKVIKEFLDANGVKYNVG